MRCKSIIFLVSILLISFVSAQDVTIHLKTLPTMDVYTSLLETGDEEFKVIQLLSELDIDLKITFYAGEHYKVQIKEQ